MEQTMERRKEKRLRYNWPIWFAENFNDILIQGQMIDISSGGAAFTCYTDACPFPGQHLTTRFSIPHYNEDDSFNMDSFIREGHVCRVDNISPYIRRVAVQFANPLPFKPGQPSEQPSLAEHETALAGVPS